MKKFGLFISIALLTAFVGCDSDDVEDPVVPAVSKPVVAVSENTPTSFGVEWDAVDEAAGYQYVVTESDAAGNTSEFCPETQTDKTSLRFDDAAAGAKYTVKVKALAAADSQLADSEYAEIFVETPAEGLSSQTFAFTVDPVGYDSAKVKVEPSIADETYFFAVVKSSLLLDKNSNAIIEMLKKDIEPESLVKGERTIETKWLDPETAYVAVAFGYDADRGASTAVAWIRSIRDIRLWCFNSSPMRNVSIIVGRKVLLSMSWSSSAKICCCRLCSWTRASKTPVPRVIPTLRGTIVR